MNLFDTDIAGLVGDAMKGNLLPAVLTKVVSGGRDPANRTKMLDATETAYGAEGFIESYTDLELNGTSIKRRDRKITLMAALIEGGQIPMIGDTIFIEEETWEIAGVPARDPAGATFVCQGR
ncbi:MAG: hypothetical protein COB09_18555 [Thalassobium sp.]|nr:MAG: hypothetical protein COB09_18555 [Thalassobium sp.]